MPFLPGLGNNLWHASLSSKLKRCSNSSPSSGCQQTNLCVRPKFLGSSRQSVGLASSDSGHRRQCASSSASALPATPHIGSGSARSIGPASHEGGNRRSGQGVCVDWNVPCKRRSRSAGSDAAARKYQSLSDRLDHRRWKHRRPLSNGAA